MTQRVSCLEKMLFIFQIKNKYHALWMQAITDVSVELLKGKGPRKPKKVVNSHRSVPAALICGELEDGAQGQVTGLIAALGQYQ